MATKRALAGVAHDIAHHAASGLSYFSLDMAQALRDAGLDTTTLELLEPSPYPQGVKELRPLRLALQTLHATVEGILERNGLTRSDGTSIKLCATRR